MRRLIEPSHLDLCCLQKPIVIACGSERVKVLRVSRFQKCLASIPFMVYDETLD